MSAATPERRLILKALADLRQSEQSAKSYLRQTNVFDGLEAAAKASAHRKLLLVRRCKDFVLELAAPYSKGLKARDKDIIALCATELFYDGLAPHIALSQATELARIHHEQSARRVRAIMHRLIDEILPCFVSFEELVGQTEANDFLKKLSLASALSVDFLELAAQSLSPAELIDFSRKSLLAADTYFCLAPSMRSETRELLEQEGIELDFYSELLFRANIPHQLLQDLIQKQALYPCSLASYQVVEALGLEHADKILEVGQGRATKTLLMHALAATEKKTIYSTALELSEQKSQTARSRLKAALPEEKILCLAQDARELKNPATATELLHKSAEFFSLDLAGYDLVFIDAPCSGSGTISRHAEIAGRFDTAALADLSKLQLELLEAAAALVLPGQRLAYATCSIFKAENEGLVERFLASEVGSRFKLVNAGLLGQGSSDLHFLAQFEAIK